MGLLLQLGWLDVGYVIGARQLAWTRQLAWARLLPGAIKKVGARGELLHLSDWEAPAAKGSVSVAIGEPQEFWLGKP